MSDFLISLHQTIITEENEDIHTRSKQNNSAIKSSISGAVHLSAMSEAFSSQPLNWQVQILHQTTLSEKLDVDGLLLQKYSCRKAVFNIAINQLL